MTQTLNLNESLLKELQAGKGNRNTIREGKRDIVPGQLQFTGTDSGQHVMVYVTNVIHKKLSDITHAEALANGSSSVDACVQNMLALYKSLGRPMTLESDITLIEYTPYRQIDLASLDFSAGETRWRGGEHMARWMRAGEVVVKRDGTPSTTNGGEVGIIEAGSITAQNPGGKISWALPLPTAQGSYVLDALPKKNRLDTTPAPIQRFVQEVKTLAMHEPVAFVSPFPEDKGQLRYLKPGELLEFNAKATPPISPVNAKDMLTRYVSEEAARAQLGGQAR